MMLPSLSVTQVFGHFESSYTKDEILSTIENYEYNTNNANPSNELSKYSNNKWISKEAFTENVEANAEYSRKYIKTPYVPVEFFDLSEIIMVLIKQLNFRVLLMKMYLLIYYNITLK